MIKVKRVVVGFIKENCYIVYHQSTGDAVIIDPGADGEDILESLDGLNPKAILATHGHMDHIGQVGFLKKIFDIPFYMSKKDYFLTDDELFDSFRSMIDAHPCPYPDFDLEEIDYINFGEIKFQTIKTPGHTPGGTCFYSKEDKFIFVGDTLFSSSIGRTDLPGGNGRELEESLRRILQLPDDVVVYPGHGPATTIGKERRENPFITGRFKIRW